jgi:hypothetical protein
LKTYHLATPISSRKKAFRQKILTLTLTTDDRLLARYLQSFRLSRLYLDNVFESPETARYRFDEKIYGPTFALLKILAKALINEKITKIRDQKLVLKIST